MTNTVLFRAIVLEVSVGVRDLNGGPLAFSNLSISSTWVRGREKERERIGLVEVEKLHDETSARRQRPPQRLCFWVERETLLSGMN